MKHVEKKITWNESYGGKNVRKINESYGERILKEKKKLRTKIKTHAIREQMCET